MKETIIPQTTSNRGNARDNIMPHVDRPMFDPSHSMEQKREEVISLIFWLRSMLAGAEDKLLMIETGLEFCEGKATLISAVIPDTITLTSDLIHSACTSNGGFKNAQIRILGFTHPKKGWLQSMVGKTIPCSQWEAFVAAGK